MGAGDVRRRIVPARAADVKRRAAPSARGDDGRHAAWRAPVRRHAVTTRRTCAAYRHATRSTRCDPRHRPSHYSPRHPYFPSPPPFAFCCAPRHIRAERRGGPATPSPATRNTAVQNTEYDAIVVGSGISGGWAAKELTEKGLRVLLLERGKNV